MVVFSIPEAIIIFLLAFSLLGKKISNSRLLVVGVVAGVLNDLIHLFIENYILIIIVSCFFTVILLVKFGTTEIHAAITSGIMAISLYLAIEFINIITLQALTGISPALLQEDFTRKFLWFLPQIVAALALSRLIHYFVNHYGNHK